ncbi:hypothetical protein H2200_002584 [Cladophialophora chaetospira]|uniref:NAD(P)-binding domain-containing protein n=1 Tax=Cladophialophora chaetospira TaxID=386627 RepID=A0AA38XJY8_9EURO|nr:hypothetical protein H2200_002584 [Cladophialophora chaetospira]
MVKVAVAGGTGSVGSTIVDALKSSQKHDVIVLSRKTSHQSALAAAEFVVDYANIEHVSNLLETENVHTVISTIAVLNEASGKSELDLVAAAAKSSTTKRFIASNWGGVIPEDESLRIPFQKYRLETLKALEKTDLEWTQFQNGYFLDFYGIPYVETNLKPLTFVLDMAHKAASIPGTGNEQMTFTYTKDLAKFVVSALDLPTWTYPMVCYSEKSTWNKVVKLAEGYRGSKFNIAYDSPEKLQRGEITELPAHAAAYSFVPKSVLYGIQSKFGLYVANGMFDLPEEGSLNQKFPELKTTTIDEIIGHWKDR